MAASQKVVELHQLASAVVGLYQCWFVVGRIGCHGAGVRLFLRRLSVCPGPHAGPILSDCKALFSILKVSDGSEIIIVFSWS